MFSRFQSYIGPDISGRQAKTTLEIERIERLKAQLPTIVSITMLYSLCTHKLTQQTISGKDVTTPNNIAPPKPSDKPQCVFIKDVEQ